MSMDLTGSTNFAVSHGGVNLSLLDAISRRLETIKNSTYRDSDTVPLYKLWQRAGADELARACCRLELHTLWMDGNHVYVVDTIRQELMQEGN